MKPAENGSGSGAPLVSVITPVYNRADYLAEAIESVMAQTFTNWELLVIDDGSDTKDSHQVADPFCRRDARIRYHYETHGGTSTARNHGIAMARGKYLAFLDSDDRYLPEGLAVLIEAMHSAHESVKLVYGNFVKYFQAEHRFKPTKVRPPLPRPGLYLQFLVPGSNPVAPSACLIERNVIDEIGGFNTSYTTIEDRELLSRLVRIHNIKHVARDVAIYRKHSNQQTNDSHRAQRRLANDRQAYEFFFSMPLASWFPEAHSEKSYTKPLDHLALLLLKSQNSPVDTALHMLRLAQKLNPSQKRQKFMGNLEREIPGFLLKEYGCSERITIPNT